MTDFVYFFLYLYGTIWNSVWDFHWGSITHNVRHLTFYVEPIYDQVPIMQLSFICYILNQSFKNYMYLEILFVYMHERFILCMLRIHSKGKKQHSICIWYNTFYSTIPMYNKCIWALTYWKICMAPAYVNQRKRRSILRFRPFSLFLHLHDLPF